MSAILSPRQISALVRIGDILIPAGEGFPSFSETGAIAHVDALLEVTPSEDVGGLKILLSVLSFLPDFMVAGFLGLVRKADALPDFLAAPLRNIEIGLKGLVMSLYYSNRVRPEYRGPKVHEVIDYALRVVKP